MVENLLDATSPFLVVVRGCPLQGNLTFNLTKIYQAEQRLSEISFLTNHATAGELMHFFNNAANDCGRYLGALTYEELTAQNELDKVKSVIVLDIMPEELQKRGVTKTNEDFRQAIITQNVDYQKQLDILNHIKAVSMFITEKYRSFVRAYNACKLISDQRQMVPHNPNTSTSIGSTEVIDINDPDYLRVTR